MKASVPTFACFAPNPAAHLTPTQARVLSALRQAKGFFRSSGLTVTDIAHRLHNSLTSREIRSALTSLSALKPIRSGLTAGAWRVK